MWLYWVLGLVCVAIVFAEFYTRDFIKYNPKYKILQQGMNDKQIKKFVFIFALMAGICLAPFMILWFINKLFKKRGQVNE